jgi:hypothetical protein
MKICFTFEHEKVGAKTSLEAADVKPCWSCQALTVGMSTVGAGSGGLESQAHRLRPKGLLLSTPFAANFACRETVS